MSTESVEKLNQGTQLALAMKQPAAVAVIEHVASTLRDVIEQLVFSDMPGDRSLDLLSEARGIVKALRALGYDVQKVTDLATRKGVERQVAMTLPYRRRPHEGSIEGEARHRE